VTSVPLYAIRWTGSGFSFDTEHDIAVPSTGVATCSVPGPVCSVAVDVVTTSLYPADSANPSYLWGVSPRIDGGQVQVGDWSDDPRGNYVAWGETTTTNSCLFGTEHGRIYGASGTYTEYQLVIYGQY
jgi:hypothetical protein